MKLLGFCPNSVLTMQIRPEIARSFINLNRWNDSMGTTIENGAIKSGEKYLGKNGWTKGKHI